MRFRAVYYSGSKILRHTEFATITQVLILPQFAKAALLEPMNEDALTMVFLPVANSSLFPDPAFAVLAKTATDWSAPTLASEIHINVEYSCIRTAGHADSANPLKSLERVLLRLPGIGGLDMTVTMEALINPLRTYPAVQHSQHVG